VALKVATGTHTLTFDNRDMAAIVKAVASTTIVRLRRAMRVSAEWFG
jgi:hypothetical protein